MISPPTHPFDANDKDWQHYAFTLASELDLPLQNIAALCGTNWQSLKSNHKVLQGVIARGRATYKARMLSELAGFAFADPALTDDPIERARIHTLKLDAVKTWLKLDAKREEMEMLSLDKDKDRNALKDLTVEELKAKAKELLK